MAGEEAAGPGAFRPFFQRTRMAIPDIHFTVEDALVDGGNIAVRCRVTGTHTGPGLTAAPANQTINVTGMVFARGVACPPSRRHSASRHRYSTPAHRRAAETPRPRGGVGPPCQAKQQFTGGDRRYAQRCHRSGNNAPHHSRMLPDQMSDDVCVAHIARQSAHPSKGSRSLACWSRSCSLRKSAETSAPFRAAKNPSHVRHHHGWQCRDMGRRMASIQIYAVAYSRRRVMLHTVMSQALWMPTSSSNPIDSASAAHPCSSRNAKAAPDAASNR